MTIRAIVLAAGKGTRMKTDLPKVLHPAAGRPLISWVTDAVGAAGVDDIVVVVGHGADAVAAALPEGTRTAVQESQDGTGHAALVAVEALGDVAGDTLLVVPGDSPLMTSDTIAALLDAHAANDAACTLLTARLPDPTGYGRVIRDGDRVAAIVEESDADDTQRTIDEVAVSTYVFDGAALRDALGGIGTDNRQGEMYLTDAIALLASSGGVEALAAAEPEEVLGVNSHQQLALVNGVLRDRLNRAWMDEGVWMQDPSRIYVEATVTLEPGARIYAGTHLEGATTVAAGAEVGPDVFARDTVIGDGARVWYSVVRGADIGPEVEVGPYASLRPGTVLRRGAKAGTFVEMKATTVGEGSKVPHLSYLGDATVGEHSNIGAGTITCNYDGFEKHETVIGDRVFVGSDTMLVAPVEIGDGAFTGAGSVITRDVTPGSLAVERSSQKEIPGYADRKARLAESEDD
jgi:bifunctional UDP-N-acetylglucosamine pyrophosphorylase/glucosamine-1-phosphate N-acetyltransferase